MDTGLVDAILIGWFVLTAGMITFVYLRSRSNQDHNAVLETLANASALYSDSFCSGRSLKSFRTKFGGARNCLKVVVTRDELFVLAPIRFLVYFTEKFDLEHSIAKKSISEFAKFRRLQLPGYRVTYISQNGEAHTIELWPRRPKEFEQAMNVELRATP
jgi:hypothetical protein